MPVAWSRLIDAAEDGQAGEARVAPTLGFLLEIFQDEPPMARVEVAPVLLETMSGGRLGRAVPLDSKQL
ncbi:MAG: hypothetical protein ACREPF_12390, partial [Rhodanobacteraceae bacterium]